MKKSDVYKHALDIIKSCPNTLEADYELRQISYTLENAVATLELQEVFGIDLPYGKYNQYNGNILPITEEQRLLKFGGGSGAKIAWEDSDQTPGDGWLYVLRFPTGAYFFGDDNPTELFNDFFRELCTYNPNYRDTMNRYLYFSPENTAAIHNDFKHIVKHYRDRYKAEYMERKKAKLLAELKKLGGVG